MSIKYDKYMPLYAYLSPASIPQIVAHIQDYLVKHPILSAETIAEIIVESLQEHPELINGTAIPISADSEQSIKAYIDSLPSIDTYTKAEINALLTGKQDTLTFDQAPTPGSSNPVTSSGIIAAMSAMNEALETLINSKADSATTYTKTQVDTLLTDKANADDVYSKNTMDAKLLEYAPSESVYSKQDINTMKQVNKANLAIVSTDGLAPLDIAAGQYVYFNDVMYMATEEILTGAQLVPNANIVINPIGVTNRIGDGLKNAVTQINGLADRMTLAEEGLSSQSQQIGNLVSLKTTVKTDLVSAVNANFDALQGVEFTGYSFPSHISKDAGGVYKIGNLVIIQMRVVTTRTSGGEAFIYGMPNAKDANWNVNLVPVLCEKLDDKTVYQLFVTGGGAWWNYGQWPEGMYHLSGVYVSQ